TLLPGATRMVEITDRVAGDQLMLVPAIFGHAVLNERSYVEFGALKNPSCLPLTAFVHAFSVKVHPARPTLAHAGGLALSPPTAPVVDSPEALANSAGGPSYLDFASWSRIEGGSFLATERRLRAAIARLPDQSANNARLRLARFYLSNQFAAE